MSKENLSFPEKCHNKAKQNKWDSAWRKNEKKTNKQKQNKTTRQRSAEEKLIRKHVFSTMDREISLTGQISYSPWRWRCVFACLFVSVCVCVGGGRVCERQAERAASTLHECDTQRSLLDSEWWKCIIANVFISPIS